MAGMIGMTPNEGRALAGQLDRSSASVKQTVDRLIARLDETAWEGEDRRQFEERLRGHHRNAVLAAIDALRHAAVELRRHATDQERVSGR